MLKRWEVIGFVVWSASIALIPVLAQTGTDSGSGVKPAEYEVFSAYISAEFTGKRGEDRVGAGISQIVIADKTLSDEDDSALTDDRNRHLAWSYLTREIRKQAPTVRRKTLDAFRQAADRTEELRRDFRLPLKYQLVHPADIAAIFKNGGWWDDFYRKYPSSQGVIALSRVGFSPDGRQAIFYAVNSCGGKCGTGSYVVMEKAGSEWRMRQEIVMWIS